MTELLRTARCPVIRHNLFDLAVVSRHKWPALIGSVGEAAGDLGAAPPTRAPQRFEWHCRTPARSASSCTRLDAAGTRCPLRTLTKNTAPTARSGCEGCRSFAQLQGGPFVDGQCISAVAVSMRAFYRSAGGLLN